MAKRTIVVFGATGKQGGSVVKSILADPEAASQFHVKAVTRDPTKGNAKALADLGAELVAVSLAPQLSPRLILHSPLITRSRPGRPRRQRLSRPGHQGRLWRLRRHELLDQAQRRN